MNAPAALPPLPMHNCYWVVPGLVLAGEHPGGPTPARTKQRLDRLLSAGIGAFLDLTHPEEVPRYDQELPFSIDYRRHAIVDHGLPASPAHMIEILDSVQECLSARRPLYVHCRAGIGRTGIVMGCLLAERGLSGDEALRELNRLWQQCRRSKNWAFVPETDDQVNYIRSWQGRALRAAKLPSKAPVRVRAPVRVQAPVSRTADVPPPAPLSPAAPSRERPAVLKAPAPRVVSDPLLEPDTLSAARGLRERFMGALLGLAVGDAVAAATQFGRPGSFRPVGDMLGGGPFDLPRGGWSDDTAMALCLADSLLERNGFDARDQVTRYTRWQQDGYLSATGHAVGITASTARALAMSKWRRQMFAGSHDPKLLDPEPLS
ncbi:MAG TPA: ADP-ribosylglycohydrolase family protein, partial [Steroidobacteraceae bacterium]|nr:ADP-ribosylglycohydrolase family protein [Steroidobacteraceae bacterium]